jgi:hypothetical protein
VETLKQIQDHMQNEVLQFNSILTTTTTNILQIIYDYNPPKRFAKFKNIYLAGNSSNTLLAGYPMLPILKI